MRRPEEQLASFSSSAYLSIDVSQHGGRVVLRSFQDLDGPCGPGVVGRSVHGAEVAHPDRLMQDIAARASSSNSTTYHHDL